MYKAMWDCIRDTTKIVDTIIHINVGAINVVGSRSVVLEREHHSRMVICEECVQ